MNATMFERKEQYDNIWQYLLKYLQIRVINNCLMCKINSFDEALDAALKYLNENKSRIYSKKLSDKAHEYETPCYTIVLERDEAEDAIAICITVKDPGCIRPVNMRVINEIFKICKD